MTLFLSSEDGSGAGERPGVAGNLTPRQPALAFWVNSACLAGDGVTGHPLGDRRAGAWPPPLRSQSPTHPRGSGGTAVAPRAPRSPLDFPDHTLQWALAQPRRAQGAFWAPHISHTVSGDTAGRGAATAPRGQMPEGREAPPPAPSPGPQGWPGSPGESSGPGSDHDVPG